MRIDVCPECGGAYEEGSSTCPYCKTFNKERDIYLREQKRKDEKSSAIAKICIYGFIITTAVTLAGKVIFMAIMGLAAIVGGRV